MKSADFAAKVNTDFAASFWLAKAIKELTKRDVLDALIDAEALCAFCRLRAEEAGLTMDKKH